MHLLAGGVSSHGFVDGFGRRAVGKSNGMTRTTATHESLPHATDNVGVAIVGAGQAGLAAGYFVQRHGLRFAIFERAGAIGAAWRERWNSLTLFTPRRYSALPGLPFPGDPDGYPTRDEVISY